MQAGRELDALIAEKVMGWRRYPVPFNREQTALLPSLAAVELLKLGMDLNGLAPQYSTDIATAWRVVEKLTTRDGQPYFEIRTCGQYYTAVFTLQRSEVTGASDGDTAPLAICLAALKAVSQ